MVRSKLSTFFHPVLNGTTSRNANMTWTPAPATRSSLSNSTVLRSSRSGGVSSRWCSACSERAALLPAPVGSGSGGGLKARGRSPHHSGAPVARDEARRLVRCHGQQGQVAGRDRVGQLSAGLAKPDGEGRGE